MAIMNGNPEGTARAVGSYSSGYGGGKDECDNGISIGLLATALLGIGVSFFTLLTKITMITGRRKRRDLNHGQADHDSVGLIVNELHDVVFGGTHFVIIIYNVVNTIVYSIKAFIIIHC